MESKMYVIKITKLAKAIHEYNEIYYFTDIKFNSEEANEPIVIGMTSNVWEAKRFSTYFSEEGIKKFRNLNEFISKCLGKHYSVSIIKINLEY